jgi:hypothetical protein
MGSTIYIDEKDDCPLKELRKILDFEKRFELIEKMSIEQKNHIIQHHNRCSMQRQIELRKVNNQNSETLTKND